MVSSISGSMPPPPPAQSSSAQSSLTDDQLQTITDVLGEYDVDNLTADDATAIVEALSDAGIEPGQELEAAMSEAGFDAREVGTLASVGGSEEEGSQPPPPPASDAMTLNISDEMLQGLNSLLDSYYSDELSDEDKATTLASIKEIFEQTVPEDGLVNITV